MTRLFPRFTFRCAGAAILCLMLGPLVPNAFGAEAAPAGQLYHNEDCTNFFWFNDNPEGKAGEIIDRYVDVIADAGVTVLLCNTNARRTNYQSRVWEAFWDGYDPAGPDDQPFLAPMRRDAVAAYRKGIGNMLAVHRQGIDYPARVVQRCRAARHLAVDHAADERLPLQRHRGPSLPRKLLEEEPAVPAAELPGLFRHVPRLRPPGGPRSLQGADRRDARPVRHRRAGTGLHARAVFVQRGQGGRGGADPDRVDSRRPQADRGGRRPAGTSRAARRPRAVAAGDCHGDGPGGDRLGQRRADRPAGRDAALGHHRVRHAAGAVARAAGHVEGDAGRRARGALPALPGRRGEHRFARA